MFIGAAATTVACKVHTVYNAVLIALCCAAVEYHSACDDEQYVYADYNNQPTLLGSNKQWPSSISVQVPTMTKVLSVSCLNYGGPAGILGSTVAPDNRILTNTAEWKCSSVYQEGWNKANFNDSAWSSAVQVGTNEIPGHYGWKPHTDAAGGPTINPKAVYIAADGVDYVANQTSYCRLKLVYQFNMICDDFSDLYADGVYIGSQTGFTTLSDPFEIPKLATLFAVKCSNNGAFHAFLGSTADGNLLTDSQWSVYYQKQKNDGTFQILAPTPPENWFDPEFVEDASWKPSLEVLDNVGPRPASGPGAWQSIAVHSEISASAWWVSGALQDKDNSRGARATRTDRSVNYLRRNLACMWTSSCQKPPL